MSLHAVRTVSEFSASTAGPSPEELRVEVHAGEPEVAQALVEAFEHLAVNAIRGDLRGELREEAAIEWEGE